MSSKTQEQKKQLAANSRKSSLKKKAEHEALAHKVVKLEAKLTKITDFRPKSTLYRHDVSRAYADMAADFAIIRKYMMDNATSLSTISGIFPSNLLSKSVYNYVH
jgi:hypothetical protein